MKKAMFKRGDTFFHPEQRMFVMIDDMQYMDSPGKDGQKGWLYNLKCFQHKNDLPKPWKRYYETRIINELQPLKKTKAVKVLYGDSGK